MEPSHVLALIGLILGSGIGFLTLLFRIGVSVGVLQHRLDVLEKERDHYVRDIALTPQLADVNRRLHKLEDP